jgi:carboxypeptidase C (cathepsin A)
LGISLIPQIQYLLASQIDILIYQGNLDLACNTAGAKRWTANLAWKGQAAFTSLDLKPWKSVKNGKEVKVGMFKEVNVKMVDGDDKKTRFAFVTIDGSGHMVCWSKGMRGNGILLMECLIGSSRPTGSSVGHAPQMVEWQIILLGRVGYSDFWSNKG